MDIRCSSCGQPYPENGIPYRCPNCAGLYDFATCPTIHADWIDLTEHSLWRYRKAFRLPEHAPKITLGEGGTPLVWEEYEGVTVGFKMEALNPTGSYKDRGSAVLVSHLLARGATMTVEDSSGNAGASFAAYCARAKIKARIYVPDTASGPKLAQIEMYGAELCSIPGPRSAAAEAVLKDANAGIPYGSHAFLPFGLDGIATIAYELWEELGGAPGTVIAPVGHGGLLLGIVRGFAALQQAGLIERTPYYVGVQAAECAPAWLAWNAGLEAMAQVGEGRTIAEGVRVRSPVRAAALCQEIDRNHGTFLAIAEEVILPAVHDLACRGLHVEPTSALTWCALQKMIGKVPEPILLILTGSGLKYRL